MNERPRFNKDAVIDDLGFRSQWNETTVRMNINRMAAILAAPNPTVESLRSEIEALKVATEKELSTLQVHAVERVRVFAEAPSAEILSLFLPRAADRLPKPSPVDGAKQQTSTEVRA